MRSALFIVLMISGSLSAFAGSNLLDLMKAGKVQYNSGCQNFIQSATHSTLKSTELQKALIPAKSFRGMDLYYFHYTNAPQISQLLRSDISDRTLAQQTILKDGGYKSIMEFQMTYSDALSNVAGVGFYVAANPFSSSSYGSTQIAMTVDPEAKVFDVVKERSLYSQVLSQKSGQGFGSCNNQIQFSLLMNENDIDLAFYSESDEWFVAFNEDIFKESQITQVSRSILPDMAKNGVLGPLMGYIKEFSNDSRSIPLADVLTYMGMGTQGGKSDALKLFSSKITTWNEGVRFLFAKIISSASGTELTTLMNEFKTSGKVQDADYLKISYESGSKDFLSLIAAMIKINPSLMKDWAADYNTRMAMMLSKNVVDMDFFLQNAPGGMSKEKLYSIVNDRNSAAVLRSSISKYIIYNDTRYFQGLKDNQKQSLLEIFMAGADPKEVPAMVYQTTKLGMDHVEIMRNMSSNYFGTQTVVYAKAVIRTQPDPKVLDGYYTGSLLANDPNQTLVDFIVELRGTKNFSRELTDALVKKLTNNLTQTNYNRLTDPMTLTAFSKSEIKIILGTMMQNGNQGIYTAVLKIFKAKGFSSYDISDTLYDYGPNTDSGIATSILAELKKDPPFWAQYTSLKNSSGVVKIFNNANAYRLQSIVKSNYPEILYTPPFDTGLINENRLGSVYTSEEFKRNFQKYSEEDKFRIVQVVSDSGYSVDTLISQTNFTPALVRKYLPGLLADKNKKDIIIRLASRPDFMSGLTMTEFKAVFAATKGYNVNKRLLADPKVIDFDKALFMTVTSYGLDRSSQDQMDALFFDPKKMTDEEFKSFVSSYIKNYDDLYDDVRNRYWGMVINKITGTNLVYEFISRWKKMDYSKARELQTIYMSSDSSIQTALKTFKAKSLNFFEIILNYDDPTNAQKMFTYIEGHYPVKEPYAGQLIYNYNSGNTAKLKTKHFKDFLCNKINNYQAVSVARDELKSSSDKRYFDSNVQTACNITIK